MGTPGAEIKTERSPIHLTWAAMEACHSKGLARNIGVSNFCGALIVDLMCYAVVHPAVLQIEMHPWVPTLRDRSHVSLAYNRFHVQQAMMDVCKAYDIHMMAYSSFGPQS